MKQSKISRFKKEVIGDIGQYISGFLVLAGIIIELIFRAHIGFLCISAGGLLWGVSTKIKGH